MKKVMFFLFVFFGLLVFSSCSNSNVIFNDNAEMMINVDFLVDNKISNAFCKEYIELTDEEKATGYYHDDNGYFTTKMYSEYPTERTFIIENQDCFNQVFKNSTNLTIDFEKKRLVLYTYVSYDKKELYFDRCAKNEDVIEVHFYNFSRLATADGCPPYQRWIYIICDNDTIKDYKFILGYKLIFAL